MTLEIITPETAQKLLDMLQAGAQNTSVTVNEILNEFINYLIFCEILSASKFLLVFVALLFIRKATNLFILGAEDETRKNQIRGGGVLVALLAVSLSLVWSWQSFLSLGKILLAPKVYVVEMAIQKVQELKGHPK